MGQTTADEFRMEMKRDLFVQENCTDRSFLRGRMPGGKPVGEHGAVYCKDKDF